MDDDTTSVADDEILFRRVPAAWYDPETGLLDDQVFAPHKKNDLTGLSLIRRKYKTIEEAAKGRPGKSYFVACLRAGDLRENGIRIEQRPPDDPSHVELPDSTASNRMEPRTRELGRKLDRLRLSVEGPFATPPE